MYGESLMDEPTLVFCCVAMVVPAVLYLLWLEWRDL
jgi:hypothetical protein